MGEAQESQAGTYPSPVIHQTPLQVVGLRAASSGNAYYSNSSRKLEILSTYNQGAVCPSTKVPFSHNLNDLGMPRFSERGWRHPPGAYRKAEFRDPPTPSVCTLTRPSHPWDPRAV